MITRRQVLACATAAGLIPTQLVRPGWSRSSLQLGEASIEIVSDGKLVLPVNMVLGRVPEDQRDAFLAANPPANGALESPLNLTLYRDGERVVLFDAGSGPNFMSSAGKLGEALEVAEVSADDVTHVVFTHAHPDHIWGVIDDFDELVFANAEYLMSQTEWDYWFNPETVNQVPEERQSFAVGARRMMQAIEERSSQFKQGVEVLPGIEAFDTAGHTPGHTSFVIRHAGDSIMVGGDVVTNAVYSFANPQWEMATDSDPAEGVKARQKLLDRLASEKMQLIGYHLPHPGTCRVEKKDGTYVYVAT